MPTPITIKRFNGENWNTVLHPITTGQNVYGSTSSLSTTALLDSSDKIQLSFIPTGNTATKVAIGNHTHSVTVSGSVSNSTGTWGTSSRRTLTITGSTSTYSV